MQNAGIYLHIPFCERKCGYCDFYSITNLNKIEVFVEGLCKEIRLRAAQYSHLTFDTVYLGGGTPSLLPIAQLKKIWEVLFRHFRISPEGEFTIEANPGTLTRTKLREIRSLGFNRLSLGVQSFRDEDLKFLNRIHTVEDIRRNYQDAREVGFGNINFDLMSAFPGLTLQKFQKTLEMAVDLRPEHVSCYTLIFEPHTPFYRKMVNGDIRPVEEDEEAAFFDTALDFLSARGYQVYEISNFALGETYRCRHNMKYWEHQNYLGFGPSAHSFISPMRWGNVRSLALYIRALLQNRLPVVSREVLTPETRQFEYIFLHLRLAEGINLSEFYNYFGEKFTEKYGDTLTTLINDDLIVHQADRIRLTRKGWRLADEVARHF
ncbi:MAG: radical SAM family heme chaperone HemW [Calditrichia bacterium]